MSKTKIPIILHIDVEPDEYFVDPRKPLPWKGYEKAHACCTTMRAGLFEATGSPVHFSWLFRMDPQIAETYGTPEWVIEHYPKYVEEVDTCGDELGLHAHAYRWDSERDAWIVDLGNQDWVDTCVQMSIAAYRKALKRDSRSFRFGDHWMNTATLILLERLGIRFDLTLEPELGQNPSPHPDQLYTGAIPDYVGVPQTPYQPSKTDFCTPAPLRKDGLWVIPMSAGRSPYGLLRRLYHRVQPSQTPKSLVRSLNLVHWPGTFSSIVNRLLPTLEQPYLSMVVRTDGFQNRQQMKNIRHNIEFLRQHPRAKEFVFATPGEALALLGHV